MGIVVGWTTNKLGMWLIFEPLQPRRILGIKVHGLFLRRQDEAAEVYARTSPTRSSPSSGSGTS